MFSTVEPGPRAIVGAIFLSCALSAAGCGPNLDRAEGGLEVTVSRIAADADAVRVEVFTVDGGASYAATLEPEGASLTHVVGSVPQGRVDVIAQSTRAGTRLQSAVATALVTEGGRAPVSLALSTSGIPGLVVESPPIAVTIGPLSAADVVQDRLEGQAAVPAAELRSFVELAQRRLPGGIAAIDLVAARVELAAGAVEIEKLQDLWRGSISLSLVAGGAEILVASAPLGEDRPGLDLAPTPGVDLASLIGPATAAVLVRLSGPADIEPRETRSSSLAVTIALRARSEG